MKIISWNVNGIRAAAKKGLLEWMSRVDPDILCIQETKVGDPAILDEALRAPRGYHAFWDCHATKKGYSGVAVFSKEPPQTVEHGFGVPVFDCEGRILVAHYAAFTLLNVYFPNGKQNSERLRYKLAFYDAFLAFCDTLKKKGVPLVMCGDYNTAHKEIDLARPKENAGVSGFLPEERAWIDRYISHGYTDTLRLFHTEPHLYSWWDMKTRARERNIGWRIDYFFVSDEVKHAVTDAFVMADVYGSDHCPVGIEFDTHKKSKLY